jgi:hypothetical protein
MKRHIRILALTTAVVLIVAILERIFPVAQGRFVGALELILELAALFLFIFSEWARTDGTCGSAAF